MPIERGMSPLLRLSRDRGHALLGLRRWSSPSLRLRKSLCKLLMSRALRLTALRGRGGHPVLGGLPPRGVRCRTCSRSTRLRLLDRRGGLLHTRRRTTRRWRRVLLFRRQALWPPSISTCLVPEFVNLVIGELGILSVEEGISP